tara:strand:- start:506 stop:1123 length:618 start_codon:yes stop_codon:yes gene_type:complete
MESLIKSSSVLYDKEICDIMNKLKLDQKIIIENKYPEVVFKNTDEYYNKKKKSSKILRDGIENNINKFIEPFDNRWNVRRYCGAECTIYDCFYESIYNCLFNILDTEIYCKYQAEKISYEIDDVIDILYNKEILDISHESKEEVVELIYDLIDVRLNNEDGLGLIDIEHMYFVCSNCNKNTNWNNLNCGSSFDKIICLICQPYDN